MSRLIIETDTIKKGVLYIFAIVGVLAITGMIVTVAVDHYSEQRAHHTVVPASASSATAPAPTVVPTVIPASVYPAIIEFTVLSTTVANGHYSVYTTAGQTLYMPDFHSWNSLLPRNTYAATITGAETNGALDVLTLNSLSLVNYQTVTHPVSYPVSYPASGVKEFPRTWTLRGSSHTGTVTLNPDGTGSARIDSFPTFSFLYTMAADGTHGMASYSFWSVPLTYDPFNTVITSPKYPGAELVPTG
ncbi:MAG: hypothetical protein ABFC78_07085 [Methanoregula sp.]